MIVANFHGSYVENHLDQNQQYQRKKKISLYMCIAIEIPIGLIASWEKFIRTS